MNFLQGIASALTPAGLIWTLLIITVATFLHELAHYALARWQGVKVNSFSIGMGPVLVKQMWRGTEWRLSLLPIGGYVEIDGMAPDLEDGTARAPTRGFAALSPLGKIAVLLAGPVMNLLVAFLIITATLSANGLTTPIESQITISQVLPNSKAEELGLKAGDTITAIDGSALPQSYREAGQDKPGWQRLASVLGVSGAHRLTIERSGQTLQVPFDWTAKVGGVQQKLGVAYGPGQKVTPLSLPGAAVQSGKVLVGAVPQVLNAFKNLFVRFFTLNLKTDEGVVGPVGTVQVVSQAASLGGWTLLGIAAAINLSLGFFNLLPIPGLDGGRILLVLVGVLRGRPLTFAQEQAVTVAGFGLVMLLTAFVLVRDLARFF
ncbi:RIP metalloprotease [Deinococcus psychrotolerans]|uniref:RIP metalloprotease n=1 Tax=Deinococcus psychrotolerans TaxID=2489213 RepID=A0A3G8Y9W6_9DEIO|nr:M50 family metallopeptidase [Deinococcus psychrotolerans]AZI42159.1 RIP metalloprotease [Deinococcus psychrotolerans]